MQRNPATKYHSRRGLEVAVRLPGSLPLKARSLVLLLTNLRFWALAIQGDLQGCFSMVPFHWTNEGTEAS